VRVILCVRRWASLVTSPPLPPLLRDALTSVASASPSPSPSLPVLPSFRFNAR